MRACDIEINKSYRHISTPKYGWAKAVKVLKPKEDENPHNRIIVKCEWSVGKNDNFSLIKYYKPKDLLNT